MEKQEWKLFNNNSIEPVQDAEITNLNAVSEVDAKRVYGSLPVQQFMLSLHNAHK